MIKKKVMEPTITSAVISIKGSGRKTIEKDMGYSYRMMDI